MTALVVVRAGVEGRHVANPRKYRTTLCGAPWDEMAEDDVPATCPTCLGKGPRDG